MASSAGYGSGPRAIAQDIVRFVSDVRGSLRRHRMSTSERRAIQRAAAKDPNVERAVQEVLAAHPELRRWGTADRGVLSRHDQG